jgi:hypothetical protein
MAEAINTTKTRYNDWDYSGNEELVVSYLKRIFENITPLSF